MTYSEICPHRLSMSGDRFFHEGAVLQGLSWDIMDMVPGGQGTAAWGAGYGSGALIKESHHSQSVALKLHRPTHLAMTLPGDPSGAKVSETHSEPAGLHWGCCRDGGC